MTGTATIADSSGPTSPPAQTNRARSPSRFMSGRAPSDRSVSTVCRPMLRVSASTATISTRFAIENASAIRSVWVTTALADRLAAKQASRNGTSLRNRARSSTATAQALGSQIGLTDSPTWASSRLRQARARKASPPVSPQTMLRRSSGPAAMPGRRSQPAWTARRRASGARPNGVCGRAATGPASDRAQANSASGASVWPCRL